MTVHSLTGPQAELALGGREAEGVVMAEGHDPKYRNGLSSATFCGVFPGNGWSGRMVRTRPPYRYEIEVCRDDAN